MNQPINLLISGGVVIAMDPERRVIADGAVAIAGSRLVAVGPRAEVEAAHGPAKRRIDATGKAVLPGFIDLHGHAGHALAKSIGDTGEDWMHLTGALYARGADTDFWRVEALLSGLERIRCGTTTACLLFGGGPDVMRTEDTRAADAHLQAIEQLGLREVLAVGPGRPPFPLAYLDWDHGATPREVSVTPERQIDTAETIIDRWHGKAGGNIRIACSLPVFLDQRWTDQEVRLSVRTRELAQRKGVLLVQDGHREGSIARSQRFAGLPAPNAVFAHCVELTEDDIATLERSGAKVAHNPSALMSVRGRCPAPELMQRGIVVGIGSDGPAPDRPFDMFRHLFQLMRYHARHFRDDTVLPATRALEMATIEGAKALGMEKEIGSLEPGKRADVILVDLTAPHLAPLGAPVRRLATFANGGDVDMVLVNGRILMEGRKVPGHDMLAIGREAQASASRALERIGFTADQFGWS
ncbi:MAG: amidohydrolase family protein [Alphaproteobacteria bacterium]|nr:amidohydrolase family protein [Alphaproteobacteria bacterium]